MHGDHSPFPYPGETCLGRGFGLFCRCCSLVGSWCLLVPIKSQLLLYLSVGRREMFVVQVFCFEC